MLQNSAWVIHIEGTIIIIKYYIMNICYIILYFIMHIIYLICNLMKIFLKMCKVYFRHKKVDINVLVYTYIYFKYYKHR